MNWEPEVFCKFCLPLNLASPLARPIIEEVVALDLVRVRLFLSRLLAVTGPTTEALF